MPRVTIDNREIEVPAGTTLLEAARRLGIDVPTLCYLDGLPPNTTCMVCVMKARGRNGVEVSEDPGRMVPSCATVVEDGMVVESDSEEVHAARRMSLDLLLSDHAAECHAPCQLACPFDTDIPGMIRRIADGRIEAAIEILRGAIPLGTVLTRIAPEISEGGCRRRVVDEAVSIGMLKRYVADRAFTVEGIDLLHRESASGKRVAIIGAGPAGLSAAYFLARRGHDCVLFEREEQPGGSMRGAVRERDCEEQFETECELLRRMGARFELGREVDTSSGVGELASEYDAVLLATGRPVENDSIARSQTSDSPAGSRFHMGDGVFAAGDLVQARGKPARAAVDGKLAAECIDQYLRGEPVTGHEKLFTLGTGRPDDDEITGLMVEASSTERVVPRDVEVGLTDEEARAEARRCMYCDCRSLSSCKLKQYADRYGASAKRYRGQRRRMERVATHSEVVFEPGKCILCGLCVQIAERAGEKLGLTYIGRGFDVRVEVPLSGSLADALKSTARECIEACPTGALAWKREGGCAGCSSDGVCQRDSTDLDPKQ